MSVRQEPEPCPTCGGVTTCPAEVMTAGVATVPDACLRHQHASMGWCALAGPGESCRLDPGFGYRRWAKGHRSVVEYLDVPAGWRVETVGSAGRARVRAHWPDVQPQWVRQCTYAVLVEED